jgi:predicted nuclease with TOPRIM domain
MSLSIENSALPGVQMVPDRIRVRTLQQMAEALEDEAAGLDRRAAAFEEEELVVTREVQAHQTEINRLLLRLQSIRSERDSVVERIEKLGTEARHLKQRSLSSEDEEGLGAMESCEFDDRMNRRTDLADSRGVSGQDRSTYFRRMSVTDFID